MTTQNTHAAPDLAAPYTAGPWYEASTGNHQALIISEHTGANVAVCYDKKDAALIASAPELLAALEWAETFAEGSRDARPELNNAVFNAHIARARAALAKAKGGA